MGDRMPIFPVIKKIVYSYRCFPVYRKLSPRVYEQEFSCLVTINNIVP